MITRILLLALLAAMPSWARQTKPCVEIYPELARAGWGLSEKATELKGPEIAAAGLEPFKIKEGTRVFLVGKGSTALVYRLVSPSGAAHLLKVYRTQDRNADSSVNAERYARDKKYLEKFAAASKHPPTDTLEVIPVQAAKDKELALKMKDFKGFQLGKVLELLRDEAPAKYLQLVTEYNRRLANFVADLKAGGMEIVEGPKDPEHPAIKLYRLKIPNDDGIYDVADVFNTLYDPQTGRFVINDPF